MMCGLFGFVNYSGKEMKNLAELTNSLAEQSAVRGTDATGIAFCDMVGVNVLKDNKPAYRLDFKHSDSVCALIGHTRHSTKGSENFNENNHPFYGECKNSKFALAHNGVLSNDKELRKKFNLPKTKIETDSYVAVQLIESQKRLNFESVRYMSEKTKGSFSYSLLDDKNNVWLVKGDSPLSIIHFPNQKMYVYASTDEILYKALVDYAPLFSEIKNGKVEVIDISAGEILKIRPDGIIERGLFEYSYYLGRDWWDYGSFWEVDAEETNINNAQNEYKEALKSMAVYFGYSPEEIDGLISAGFALEEIEEYIYCGGEV